MRFCTVYISTHVFGLWYTYILVKQASIYATRIFWPLVYCWRLWRQCGPLWKRKGQKSERIIVEKIGKGSYTRQNSCMRCRRTSRVAENTRDLWPLCFDLWLKCRWPWTQTGRNWFHAWSKWAAASSGVERQGRSLPLTTAYPGRPVVASNGQLTHFNSTDASL